METTNMDPRERLVVWLRNFVHRDVIETVLIQDCHHFSRLQSAVSVRGANSGFHQLDSYLQSPVLTMVSAQYYISL